MERDRRIGVVLVLAAAALWGTTGTAQTFASGELSPVWFGALRLVVAAAFFALYALAVHRVWPKARPLAPVLIAGACMALYNLAFFAGIRDTGVAIGTAVALGSGPVWAGLLQSTLTGRAPPRGWWVGTAIAVAGGVLMSLAGSAGATRIGGVGVALCLLAGLAYAGYTLASKELVAAGGADGATFPVFAIAAAIAVAAAWLNTPGPKIHATDLWALAYVGIASAGLAYLLFTRALRHISAATGVTLALGEPVMAFALAVMVVGERPAPHAFVGLALVMAGVLAVVRAELTSARIPTIVRNNVGPVSQPERCSR